MLCGYGNRVNDDAQLDTSVVEDARSGGGIGGLGVGGLAAGGGGLGLIGVIIVVLFNVLGGGGTSGLPGGLTGLSGVGSSGVTSVDNEQLAESCHTGKDANTRTDARWSPTSSRSRTTGTPSCRRSGPPTSTRPPGSSAARRQPAAVPPMPGSVRSTARPTTRSTSTCPSSTSCAASSVRPVVPSSMPTCWRTSTAITCRNCSAWRTGATTPPPGRLRLGAAGAAGRLLRRRVGARGLACPTGAARR